MSDRLVTLHGGPHEGRELNLTGQHHSELRTVEVLRNPDPVLPPPLKWWERLIGRKQQFPPPHEPYTLIAHRYNAQTGAYLGVAGRS